MLAKIQKFLSDHYNALGIILDELEDAIAAGATVVSPAAGAAVAAAEATVNRLAPVARAAAALAGAGPAPSTGGPLQPTSEDFMRAPAVAMSAGETLGVCKAGMKRDGTGACGTVVTNQANQDRAGNFLCPRCSEPFMWLR